MRDKLKPCPFCNGQARLYSTYSYKTASQYVLVKCTYCNAASRSYYSREDPKKANWDTIACRRATNAWNRRQGQEIIIEIPADENE